MGQLLTILLSVLTLAGMTAAQAHAASVPAGYAVRDASLMGVLCDGTNDETADINRALKALQPYQALKLPAGTCVTSNMLKLVGKNHVAVIGAGKNSTIIKATNRDNSAFWTQGGDTILLADFQVYSVNKGARGHVPQNNCFSFMQSVHNVTVDGVIGRNCMGAGFLFAHTVGGLIQNNEVYRSRADAFHVAYGSRNLTLQFNRADGMGDDAYSSIATTASTGTLASSVMSGLTGGGAAASISTGPMAGSPRTTTARLWVSPVSR